MSTAVTKQPPPTAGVAEPPPFTLIEPRGLTARLADEVRRAWADLSRDPRGFVRGLLPDDKTDAKRRRRLYALLGAALAVHVAAGVMIYLTDWRVAPPPKETVRVIDLPPLASTSDPAKPDAAPDAGGAAGSGGGAGDPRPVNQGPLPQASSQPPVVMPPPPPVPKPELPTTNNIMAPDRTSPPPDALTGLTTGAVDAPPSPGEGKEGGLGSGDKGGAGPGTGPGTGGGPGGPGGPGTGNNPGGPGTGGGGNPTPGVLSFNAPKPPGFTPFTWISRATPAVTPEAQANKVSGVVLLRATFRADGRVTDIEVVRHVDYMTESAVDALRRSRFRPATVDGKPVTMTRVLVQIKVHYGGAA